MNEELFGFFLELLKVIWSNYIPWLILLLSITVVVWAVRLAVDSIGYKNSSYEKVTKNKFLSVRFNKGLYGEYLTYKKLRVRESEGARFLFNLYIPTDKESTTEIDLLMICKKGILVFESKNYSGWIFGDESQPNWTQTLPQGRGRSHKERFINPIIQNNSHINHLRKVIGEDTPFYSVIVFSERCVLKKIEMNSSDISVVKRNDVEITVDMLIKDKTDALSCEQVDEIFEKLYPYSQTSDEEKIRHIEKIEEKKASDVCPVCKAKLVLRTAKNGKNAGKQFYGCSNYPRCRYTRDA